MKYLYITVGIISSLFIDMIWTMWTLAPPTPMPAPFAVVVSVAPAETQHRQTSVRLKRADCQTYQCLEPLKKQN